MTQQYITTAGPIFKSWISLLVVSTATPRDGFSKDGIEKNVRSRAFAVNTRVGIGAYVGAEDSSFAN